MFTDTTQQQQKQPTTVTTAEEEALKRNTDCVYFLASPLTCKKGSECEYRHSEYARVNPRDCYFWLNGNCLNTKCGFRHPPLDGVLGNQGGGSAGSSMHSSHPPATSVPHAPHNTGKQAVPCVFFQKGMCLKGDRCAFLHVPNPNANKMHIPNPNANKTQQPAEDTPVTEPQPLRKPFGGLEKCSQENVPSVKVLKAHAGSRVAPKVQNAAPLNDSGLEKNVPQYVGFEGAPQNYATNVEGFSVSRSNQLFQAHGSDDNNGFQNVKDTDDFLRESSPGFDVLVDDELRDSDYYLGEDHQYGRRHQDARKSVNEYEVDINAVSSADQEVFHDPYEHMQERHYARGQHGASSERPTERSAYPKDESPDHIQESDLRYRLSKQRRVNNGMRSIVTRDHAHTHNYHEERVLRGSHRDTLPESSLSNRLQGRIKLPARVNGSDSRLERGIERGLNRSRLSPGRQQVSYPGRLQDRINGRFEENYSGEERNFKAPRMRKDMVDERSTEFATPKTLAELKGAGKDESKAELFLRKRKSLEDHHQQSEDRDLSFEGPLPLTEILKRKRASASGSGISSSVNTEETNRETKENALCTEERMEVGHDQSSEQTKTVEAENEEGMVVDEGTEDHGYEGDDQNGEYDYEEGYEEEGEYYEEGENAEGEEGYVEAEGEDEGNAFAKKIDVMFS